MGLKRVKSGEPIRAYPAADFNTLVDAAEWFQGRMLDGGSRPGRGGSAEFDGTVVVRNDSGAHRKRFEVLAIEGIIISPAQNLPEFQRATLETIRQPLEDGEVTIARAQASSTFPARFMLVAAMNPCPCGYFGHPRKPCRCSPARIEKYVSKISGPLLDRIDIHIEVPPVELDRLRATPSGDSSAVIRERVNRARRIQQQRFADRPGTTNARMTTRLLRTHCKLDQTCETILRSAVQELGLSARAHDKVLRVARTIADLEGSEHLKAEHVAEAIQYRRLDRAS